MNFTPGMLKARELWKSRNEAPRFEAKASPTSLDLLMYDAIGEDMFGGGITAKAVALALAQAPEAKTVNVLINSPGGDVFEAVGVMSALARHPGKKCVSVDGICASAASMIAMCGSEIVMAPSAMMMIHEAWGFCVGNASDMRETADLLSKVSNDAVLKSYARTGIPDAKLAEMMAAETWMNAEEAVALKFADRIAGACKPKSEKKAAASLLDLFAKVPDEARAEFKARLLAFASLKASRQTPGNPSPQSTGA